MNNKKYILGLIAILLLVIVWYYFVWANDDYTCYNYTTSESACSINNNNCTPWAGWKRTCNWTKTVTYTWWSSYRCWTYGEKQTYSTQAACSALEVDNESPSVTGWWIQ